MSLYCQLTRVAVNQIVYLTSRGLNIILHKQASIYLISVASTEYTQLARHNFAEAIVRYITQSLS